MIDWLFRNRPKWLGRLAMAWFEDGRLPMPAAWAPYVLGLGLGSRGHRVK
jgi:hypothetical protein